MLCTGLAVPNGGQQKCPTQGRVGRKLPAQCSSAIPINETININENF